MPIFENGPIRIRYEEAGAGFPMLVIPGGGLNARVESLGVAGSFSPLVEFANTHRCVALDIRNANGGDSTGPLEIDRPWDGFTDDHLALMDHLGIDKFHTLGGCIGSSFCLTLCEMTPDRISAAVLQNPVGLHPEHPEYFPDAFAKWAAAQKVDRPELADADLGSFGHNMWGGDFTFNVSRGFARNCKTPSLVLPGDDTPHPRVIGMEIADLLPNSEILVDWKGPDHIDEQSRRVVDFLAKHTPR